MVHDVITLAIERCRQPSLRDGQANAVREPLTQRSRGDLDARRAPALRMTGRSALPLSELLDVVHREVVAGQEQETVEQHARVSGGQYEAIAVRPRGIPRIVTEVACPQDVGHGGGAHRHARMSRVGLLHRIDRQRADRIDAKLVTGIRRCRRVDVWMCGGTLIHVGTSKAVVRSTVRRDVRPNISSFAG